MLPANEPAGKAIELHLRPMDSPRPSFGRRRTKVPAVCATMRRWAKSHSGQGVRSDLRSARAMNLGPLMKAVSALVAGLLRGFPTPYKVLGLYELALLGGAALLTAMAIPRSPTESKWDARLSRDGDRWETTAIDSYSLS